MIAWRVQLDVTVEIHVSAPFEWSAGDVLAGVVRGLDVTAMRPIGVAPRLVAPSDRPAESIVPVGFDLEICT